MREELGSRWFLDVARLATLFSRSFLFLLLLVVAMFFVADSAFCLFFLFTLLGVSGVVFMICAGEVWGGCGLCSYILCSRTLTVGTISVCWFTGTCTLPVRSCLANASATYSLCIPIFSHYRAVFFILFLTLYPDIYVYIADWPLPTCMCIFLLRTCDGSRTTFKIALSRRM